MAKTLREEDLVLNIIVNGNKGQKEAAELGRKMRDAKIEVQSLVAEQKKLEKQGKQNTARYKEVTRAITENNTVIDASRKKLADLGQSMKLTEKSISQLKRSLTQLTKLKNQAVPGSEQYLRYEQQIKQINARLVELGVRGRSTGNVLQRMGSTFSRYLGMITAAIASFTFATLGIRKAVDEFARFDDKVADVQKTTNLAKDEVKALSAELEKINTRTSQEDLLGLARIGGKLGLSDQNEIEGFVKSMNTIVVALNEDLGGNVEETVNQMGKLVDIFGVKETFGIEQSILKVGSAINELGMASTANEGYLVDFSKRMAGVAPLANISIQEVLGLGATLDQFGQTAEVSGTALSKLFLNMSKDAASFAKYAGMSVTGFKDLLEKDFMDAFKRVLKGVKGNSAGINELAATLGDLGLDGQRVIGVIGALANNHQVLSEQIDIANKAFEEGTSVIDEYNIKNETAAAKLDIARKEVTKFWRELGEKLYPTITNVNIGLVAFLKFITDLISFVAENYKWIITFTVAITSYTIAINAAAIATKAQTVATKIATAAQRLWNTAIALNPIGALVAVLVTAATAIALYSRRLSAAEAAQQSFNETAKEAEKTSLSERVAIERHSQALLDNKTSIEEKTASVKRLRELMPSVLKDYTDEEILAGKATAAIEKETKAILSRAKARAYENKITSLNEEMLDIESESKGKFGSGFWNNLGNQIRGAFTGRLGAQVYQDDLKDRRQAIDAELKLLEDSLKKEQKIVIDSNKGLGNPDGDDESTTVTPVGGKVKKTKGEKQLEAGLFKWNVKLAKQDPDADKAMIEIEAEYARLLKLAEGNGKAQAAVTATYEKLKWQRQLEILQEGAEKYRKRQLDELDVLNNETLEKDQQSYLDKLKLIDQMDATEDEKKIKREALRKEQSELEFTRTQEQLNARWLLLEQFQTLGDIELEEAKRIANEKAKIEKQITDNAIAESLRLATEKHQISKNISDSENAIKDATIKAYEAGFGIMKDLFKENKKLAAVFLVLEKAAAAAHVITNLQREIAGYYAANALIPGGVAIASKLALAAKIRAGISLATIAAQTITGIRESGGKSSTDNDGKTNNVQFRASGRESGGTLVQRAQDGKIFQSIINPKKRGYVGKPTVIVGENGNEFVANAQAVANPSIKPLLDIIDIAQRNGSISSLNLEKIMASSLVMQSVPGRQSGGYVGAGETSQTYINQSKNYDELYKNQRDLTDAIKRLNGVISQGITAEVALLGKNGFLAKQKELDILENNANL